MSLLPVPAILRVPAGPGAIIGRHIPIPARRIVKTYRHNVTVHWGDTDPAQIVFYPNYFAWFDESARLFFDSVGLPWEMLMEKYGIVGLPIVEAKARFLAPCAFRDEIVVESQVSEWNDKTFKLSHAVLNRGLRSVEGYEIRAWTQRRQDDPTRLKAVSIPPEIKTAFE
jgi:4-hydroxybenzoyl-CoA thioesterase